MIIHADSMPEDSILDADVCIVGAGPVGIQLARRLARNGIRVVVAESGEEAPAPRITELNAGTVTGIWTGDPRTIRLRQLGGTMHAWGGNCRPLDPFNLEPRAWVPDSGWPVSHAEIAPYLADAHDALLLDSHIYHPASPTLLPTAAAGLDFEEILFRLSRLIPGTDPRALGDFSTYYSAEIRQAENPRFILGLTICQIQLTEDRRSIAGLFAMTLQGRALHLRARSYVFAAGGIETARLLLASRDDMSCGVGNTGDSVGRYFMEHPHGLAGLLLVHRGKSRCLDKFAPGELSTMSIIQHRLRLAEAAQRRLELLDLSFQFIDVGFYASEVPQYEAHFQALEAQVQSAEDWQRYFVVFLSEQCPVRDSRIGLAEETDFFGLPQAEIHWTVNELDYRTVATGFSRLAQQVLTGDDFRLLSMVPPSLAEWKIGYGAHHIGTTRMSRSSQDGVVDQDCRIHGLSNGFCAGSSVFTTAGMANPVLTSIALALRLGDHLTAVLSAMPDADATGAIRRPAALAMWGG